MDEKGSKRFDIVVANPPYIKLDDLPQSDRESYKKALGPGFGGRADAYLTIMHLGLSCLKEGGLACFVLPQSFLDAQNAAFMRQILAKDYVVHCLIDLSRVPIFEQQSIYNILLIAEKRRPDRDSLACWIARIDSHAGTALQAILDGRETQSSRYDVFRVAQAFFKQPHWYIAPKATLILKERLAGFPTLGEQLAVRQGFISGADEIFIVNSRLFPKDQRSVFVDFLPDTEIGFFQLPSVVSTSIFFPFDNGSPLNEQELKQRFPDVWKYLSRNRKPLSKRKPVIDGSVPWWRPTRPRQPNYLLVPKIVGPHLMLTPRFAIDHRGRFAVSRAPYLAVPDGVPSAEKQAYLRFYCGLLNSSTGQWLLANFTPNYGGGYNRLEVANLKRLPAPNLATIDHNLVSRLIALVTRLERKPYEEQSILELNQMAGLVYGVPIAEFDLSSKV